MPVLALPPAELIFARAHLFAALLLLGLQVAFPLLVLFVPWASSVFNGADNHRDALECYLVKRYCLHVTFFVWGGLALFAGWPSTLADEQARLELQARAAQIKFPRAFFLTTILLFLRDSPRCVQAQLGYVFYVLAAFFALNVLALLLPLAGWAFLRAAGLSYEQFCAQLGHACARLGRACCCFHNYSGAGAAADDGEAPKVGNKRFCGGPLLVPAAGMVA